ncbi:hypothetical protein F0562_026819 [Nyssa sinensis]|uniref:PH domain-containing protein n=1 Tax=Nyssa sinensis TaxID=561372 RepID=A0A5J5BEM2_9ASTE|nr:hypothetical protein F0562_026819 [Nyssa sinensis]
MDFLCRPWSPSASHLLQIFSSTNLLPLNVNDGIEEDEEQQEAEGTSKSTAQSNRDIANNTHNIWMDLYHMKGWLKGKSITSFLRSRREQKKEQVRLHTAKLDAALSLTRLAAAIAGFSTNGSLQAPACNKDMGVVVASAAALMTTVCAETAESLGAHRALVASAVNSGLTARTPLDMITLTATAATCLRGAAVLKSRDTADTYFPKNQEMLKVGAQISIILPSGHKEYKWVTIYLKHKQLILSFRKKYLGGALTTAKEYKIINVIEEAKEARGHFFLSLKTNNGVIKLLFEDKKQSSFWISTISNLLQMFNSSETLSYKKI